MSKGKQALMSSSATCSTLASSTDQKPSIVKRVIKQSKNYAVTDEKDSSKESSDKNQAKNSQRDV